MSNKISNYSRSRVQELINSGMVSIDSNIIKNQAFKLNKVVEIKVLIPPTKKLQIKSQKIKIDIIYEDEDLIVINKKAGMVVHPAAGNYENTLVNALLEHCKSSLSGIGGIERPGIVHRLDKMTSGLLVVAKNDLTHQNLSYQFKERTIIREYEALVLGKLKNNIGKIQKNIARSKNNRKIMTVVSKDEGKVASTKYELLNEFKINENFFVNYIKCKLETGRTHQIRIHMHSIGNSILGDNYYGKKINNKVDIEENLKSLLISFYEKKRHALHAKTLGFYHPKKNQRLFFSSPLPDDIKNLINFLKKNKTVNENENHF